MTKGKNNLLDISDISKDEIKNLIKLASFFSEVSKRPVPKVPVLQARQVVTAFFEPSTRTRLSFEVAAKRLSADVVTFTASTSSITKGESVKDTAMTLQSLGADLLIVRHASAGVPHQIAGWVDVPVVNAGDGRHQHPSQALLDCYTISDTFSLIDCNFTGLEIGIVGDILNSRVARSCIEAFTALGAKVTVVATPTLLPSAKFLSVAEGSVSFTENLDEVLPQLDVLYLLRVQLERMEKNAFPTVREYNRRFGLDASRAAVMKKSAVVMHPGPINRGVEIASDVADYPNMLIGEQVKNGISMRMAIIYYILTSKYEL